MPKITKRVVDAAAPTDRDRFVWDSDVKGFGLKTTPAGRRVYVLQYRTGGRGSKTKRLTIGAHGSPWTPETARSEAKRLLGLIAAGKDPAADRRGQKQRQADAAAYTIGEMVPLFIERHCRANGRCTADEIERVLNREIVARWAKRPVADINRKEIAKLIDDTAIRSPIMANRLLSQTRRFFEWCIGRHIIADNPTFGIAAPTRERSRDRVLDDDELRDVWTACDAVG
jgi:hypothetical protein